MGEFSDDAHTRNPRGQFVDTVSVTHPNGYRRIQAIQQSTVGVGPAQYGESEFSGGARRDLAA